MPHSQRCLTDYVIPLISIIDYPSFDIVDNIILHNNEYLLKYYSLKGDRFFYALSEYPYPRNEIIYKAKVCRDNAEYYQVKDFRGCNLPIEREELIKYLMINNEGIRFYMSGRGRTLYPRIWSRNKITISNNEYYLGLLYVCIEDYEEELKSKDLSTKLNYFWYVMNIKLRGLTALFKIANSTIKVFRVVKRERNKLNITFHSTPRFQVIVYNKLEEKLKSRTCKVTLSIYSPKSSTFLVLHVFNENYIRCYIAGFAWFLTLIQQGNRVISLDDLSNNIRNICSLYNDYDSYTKKLYESCGFILKYRYIYRPSLDMIINRMYPLIRALKIFDERKPVMNVTKYNMYKKLFYRITYILA